MHDLNSFQLDDEDSSKYFINYLSDDSDSMDNSNEMESTQSNDDDLDTSSLPNCLIITPVPQDLFTNQELKDEFEQLFRAYDPQIVVLYLKFFQRVRITFTSPCNALQARLHLHEYSFHGNLLKTYFACPIIFRGASTETHLRPPEAEKLFLISPPVSPPVGWEQKIEDPPIVDLNLIAAMAQLQPNEPHELLTGERGTNTPSIVIHTCDDIIITDEATLRAREKLIRPKLVQTRRPPGT